MINLVLFWPLQVWVQLYSSSKDPSALFSEVKSALHTFVLVAGLSTSHSEIVSSLVSVAVIQERKFLHKSVTVETRAVIERCFADVMNLQSLNFSGKKVFMRLVEQPPSISSVTRLQKFKSTV